MVLPSQLRLHKLRNKQAIRRVIVKKQKEKRTVIVLTSLLDFHEDVELWHNSGSRNCIRPSDDILAPLDTSLCNFDKR